MKKTAKVELSDVTGASLLRVNACDKEHNMKKLRLEKIDIVMAGLCLAAIIPGLCLWNELPDKIARHFDMNGDPDGYSGKLFVIVMLPLIMTAISLFTSILINSGRSSKNPEKVKNC